MQQQPQEHEQEEHQHCQDAEQLAELPAPCLELAAPADQQLSPPPPIMDDDGSEGAGARANPPAPAPATMHSAAAGPASEQAAAGSGASSGPVVAAKEEEVPDKKQPAPATPEQQSAAIVIEGEASSTSPNVQCYEGVLETRPLSNGNLAGEKNISVQVLGNGEMIVTSAAPLRNAFLQAIQATVPGLRTLQVDPNWRQTGMHISFEAFTRTEPEPEKVPVESLSEGISSGLVPEQAVDEIPKKNKGKDKAVEVETPPPEPVSTPSTPEKPPPEINVAWEKHPERPLQKLPVRFHDAVGRNFIWPWEKAKHWKIAKSLIEAAFLHVDIIGPHVMAGHYDLIIRGAFADNDTARISPRLSSYPPQPPRFPPLEKGELSTSITTVAVIAPDGDDDDKSTPAVPVLESQTPPPPTPPLADQEKATEPSVKRSKQAKKKMSKASSSSPPLPPPPPLAKPGRGAFILPELWEDIIEPGMVIQMHMWPMSATGPPLPPPPPIRAPMPPMGMGRGVPPPPGYPRSVPAMPRGPPLIIDAIKPPKGKTRKRQDGL